MMTWDVSSNDLFTSSTALPISVGGALRNRSKSCRRAFELENSQET
ncbi:MAG: hypothetical protein ACJAYU_000321 [Bradymonadia bacterium]|jgi:hypothetical protein